MRVYTLACEFCTISYVYGTNVSRELAVRGYVVCPSCGAWNAFVEPSAARPAALQPGDDATDKRKLPSGKT